MHKVNLTLKPSTDAPIINPNIYGHFAEHLGKCIYEGLWVGEDSAIDNENGLRTDVINALRKLNIPVLRWPGGCFADEYHWKDGVGPRDKRKKIYNSHWGGVVENNHFGTHEYFELCRQLGCKSYICGNVGSGTVQEMSEWVEYMTSPAESPMANWRRENGRFEPWRLDYFGVGNESWGCGGNMRPEYYADEYRRYNTFVRDFGGPHCERIACGANTNDYRWTEVLMERSGKQMDGLSLHNYTLLGQKWPPSGSATEFGASEWFSTLRAAFGTETLVKNHAEIMDRFDPDHKVGMIVDEWGTWHPVEPGTNPGFLFQQNTMRDAMVAAIHLHGFQRNAKRVTMANIAQTVNVLQAMILTDGPRMVMTPTFWVFEMLKRHQGARHVPVQVEVDEVDGVPSVDVGVSQSDDLTLVSLACLDPVRGAHLEIDLGFECKGARGHLLRAESMQSMNSFVDPCRVEPQPISDFLIEGTKLTFDLPPLSIAALKLT